jgi:membrane protease YdiL (CAAX protease family)
MGYGALVLGGILLALVSRGLAFVGYPITEQPAIRVVLSTILLQGITFGSLAIAYVSYRGLELEFIPFRVPSKREVGVIVLGIGGIFILFFSASVVARSLGLESAQNQIVTAGRENPGLFLLMIPISLVLVGPGEELLYRGIVQGTLRESMQPRYAIIGASAIFASIHLVSLLGSGKIVYIAIAFLLALILGTIYEYTGNLVVPAIVHGVYNAIQFAGAYFATTGAL